MIMKVSSREGQAYLLEIPKGIKRKQIEKHIQEELESLHPGFSSKSLWDWYYIWQERKKYITAAVLNRKTFLQGRLENTRTAFLMQGEEGFEAVFFRPYKFTREGKIRKSGRWVLLAFVFILLGISTVVGLWTLEKEKAQQAQLTQVQDILQEPIPIQDALEKMRLLAYWLQQEGGSASSMSIIRDGTIELTIQDIAASQLASLAQEMGKSIHFGSMEHSVTGNSIQATIYGYPGISLPQFPIEIAERHDLLLDFMKSLGVMPSTSGMVDGTMWIQAIVSKKQLDTLEKQLPSYLNTLHLLVYGLTLEKTEKGTEALLYLEMQSEDNNIKACYKEVEIQVLGEVLALIDPAPPKQEVYLQQKKTKKVEVPAGSMELGKIEIGDKTTRYYRSPEGKIVILEENQ